MFCRLRGGPAGAARGAKGFLTETVSRVRDAGATGPLTVWTDSAFYSRAMLCTAAKLKVRFSVTVRQNKSIRAVTDRDGDLLELEADHRRRAIVEQSIAELKSAGLAHFPSSRFPANAAWLALPSWPTTSAVPSASSPVT